MDFFDLKMALENLGRRWQIQFMSYNGKEGVI
jgi:hypothetical protein